jgi:hypothetical protein
MREPIGKDGQLKYCAWNIEDPFVFEANIRAHFRAMFLNDWRTLPAYTPLEDRIHLDV